MHYTNLICGIVLATTATAYASELDCTPQGSLVSPCPPEVTSGRLVANFVAVPETLELLPKSTAVSHWQAANDSQISLVGGGSPASNISFDPDGLGGHGVLVVNDWSGDNRYLRGSLGGPNAAGIFIDSALPCPGDFSGDGLVSVEDVLEVIAGWGTDYNVEDLLTVLSQYGNSC